LRVAYQLFLIFWHLGVLLVKVIDPIIEKLAKEFSGKIIIGEINSDENPQTVDQLQVMSLPTVVFLKSGQPIKTLVGAQSKYTNRLLKNSSFDKQTDYYFYKKRRSMYKRVK
jgi:thioredoxin-like negative regulator of GroEL